MSLNIATRTAQKVQKAAQPLKRQVPKSKNLNQFETVTVQAVPQQQQQFEDYRNINLGFIGVGTISSSMIKGLCNPLIGEKQAKNINLSPRGERITRELESEYHQVNRMRSNQEVIDSSDWIIVGLLTKDIVNVVKDLKFREDQTIINLAAMSNDVFSNAVNQCKQIVRACPLPPVALNVGATIVSPQHESVENMFNSLGSAVAVQTDHETYSLQGLACLMGPQYSIMKTCYDWMVNKQNIDPKIATKYISRTYYSICADAMQKISNGHSFDDLVNEQTPGGLNEQNLKFLNEQGMSEQFAEVLDKTYNKMFPKM